MLPGALIVEAAAQLAGFLLEMTFNAAGEPRRAGGARADPAREVPSAGRSRRPDGNRRDDRSGMRESSAQVDFEAQVDGREAARGTLTFVMRSIDSPRVHEQRRWSTRCGRASSPLRWCCRDPGFARGIVITGMGRAGDGCDPAPFLRQRKMRKFMGRQDDMAVVAAARALAVCVARRIAARRALTGLYLAVGYIPFERRTSSGCSTPRSTPGGFRCRASRRTGSARSTRC